MKTTGFKTIILTPGRRCKCSCRAYKGSDGKNYWVDIKNYNVYITDCHKKSPKEASGIFEIPDLGVNVSINVTS